MKILITGSSSGIGNQLAKNYLAAGHIVYCCGRNGQALEKLQRSYPETANVLVFDVSDYATCETALQNLPDLDLAILNAGTCEYIDVNRFDACRFKRVFETNVDGIANCLEFILPKLNTGSTLALMGSSSSFLPLPRAEAYGASKAAIEYLANTLSISLLSQGVHVSYIAPGFVDTPLTERNDFPMPMRVGVEQAAQAIQSGIARRKRLIHFPRLFTGMLRILALLPMAVQLRLIRHAVLN